MAEAQGDRMAEYLDRSGRKVQEQMHDAVAADLGESDRKDLDETRRLLYMALMVNRTKKYNLAGTIVNAMKHHQKHEDDVRDLMDHVVALVEGNGDGEWARGQIEAITTKLDA